MKLKVLAKKVFFRPTLLVATLVVHAGTANAQDDTAVSKHEITFSASGFLKKGNEQIRVQNPEKAARMFRRAIKTDRTSRGKADAHNGLCVALIMMEEWDEALQACNEAISIYPGNWRFYNNRGNVHLGMGEIQEAVKNYEKALGMNPKSDILKTNLEIAKARQVG